MSQLIKNPKKKEDFVREIYYQLLELNSYHKENRRIAAEIIEKSGSELVKIIEGES